MVAGRDYTLVLGSLEEAARAGLIERADSTVDSYRFTHALIREVLYDELPALERLRLHGRVADTLSQMYRTDMSPVLSTIAHHYSEAAPLGYAEQAVTFELRAAERATQMCAYEDAVAHYDRALVALSANGFQDDERVVRACYLKGCACSLLGDTRVATEALLHGVKHAVRLRSPLVVDLIARLLWSTSDGPQSFLAPLLERTLSMLPEGDGVARAKALVSLASALRSTGERERIELLVTESVAMAERLKDAATLCTCVKLAIMALRAQPHTLNQRLALATMYIKAARNAGDEEALSDAFSWQVLHLLEAGLLRDLEALLDEYRRLSVARFGLHLYYVRSVEVTLDLLRGEWQNAEGNLEALLAIGSKMQRLADAEGVYSAQMFTLNRDLGRLRALQPMVVQFVRAGAGNAWLPGLMLLCAELGMLEEARQGFERLAEQDFGTIPRDEMFVTCLVYCAETCCRLGDRERAVILYSLLAPHAGGTANHPRSVCFGSTDLYLAMLAALRGDAGPALAHFETALEMNRAMEAWPWLARTLFRYGLFLRGLDSAAHLARARSMLADAEQLAAQLGMGALVGEIGSVQSSVSGAFPDQLTAREVEVLRLLAIGRTNKDISVVLAISLNTVATHVRSILEKTGAANRTEAAAYAIRMGLREPS
jgi:DNA-binding CsgD family transcriptional regulator/tetratricopeptide (TPR) repeat protein